MDFCVWSLSFSTKFPRFTRVVAWINSSFSCFVFAFLHKCHHPPTFPSKKAGSHLKMSTLSLSSRILSITHSSRWDHRPSFSGVSTLLDRYLVASLQHLSSGPQRSFYSMTLAMSFSWLRSFEGNGGHSLGKSVLGCLESVGWCGLEGSAAWGLWTRLL